MPVQNCQDNNQPGYKWGEAGKCYTYSPNNEGSKKNAKKKALVQGLAIGDIQMEDVKVSFDYHDTLTTDKGKKLLEKEMSDKNNIYIISATQHLSELLPFAERYGIPKSKVFATGSNKAKVEKLKDLNIVRHYDNSDQVRDIANKMEGLNTEIIKV